LAAVVLGIALLGAAVAPPAGALTTKTITISSTCTNGKLFCFMPSSAAVVTGRQVTWKNSTTAFHQLARCTVAACGVSGGSGTDTGYGSNVLGSGATYSFTFHGLGSYVYYCTIHGYVAMHGTITVDPAPTIMSVSPTSIARGHSNVTVHVVGSGFRNGITAKFSGTGVTVSSTTRVDSAHLTLTVSVASTATTGPRSLTVTNTDGGTRTKTGAISVT
jgi:plastocyanin